MQDDGRDGQGQNLMPVHDGQTIQIGVIQISCIHTPGHSRCSVCFLSQGNLVVGDTFFIAGVGRTDLPGGNTEELFASFEKIKQLPPETMIWPGHDYGHVTHAPLGEIMKNNPFLACRTLEDFEYMRG